MRSFATIIGILILSLIASCSPTATIESNKADNYVVQTKRLFVVATIRKYFTPAEQQAFDATFGPSLAKCFVNTFVAHLGDLTDATKEAVRKDLAKFNADSIFVIDTVSYEHRGDTVLAINYQLTLADAANRPQWKAVAKLIPKRISGSSGEAGELLANTIIDRMKQDGLVTTTCTALVKTSNEQRSLQ